MGKHISKLKQQLQELTPDEIRDYGMVINVRNDWAVRLTWTIDDSEPDMDPLFSLLDNKQLLLARLGRTRKFRELLKVCTELHEWTAMRGYHVSLRALRLRTGLRLALYTLTRGWI